MLFRVLIAFSFHLEHRLYLRGLKGVFCLFLTQSPSHQGRVKCYPFHQYKQIETLILA